MTELHDLTAVEQCAALATGKVSSAELTEHYLDRIERLAEPLGAFVNLTPDLARTEAAAADRLYAALRRALSNETVRERYRSMGVDVLDMTRAEFAAYVRADFEKWRTIAREGNIVVE